MSGVSYLPVELVYVLGGLLMVGYTMYSARGATPEERQDVIDRVDPQLPSYAATVALAGLLWPYVLFQILRHKR